MTEKRSILFVLFAAVIALAAALMGGCGEYSDSLQRILGEDEIVFGVEPDNLPMSYGDPESPGGYSVELGLEMAKRLNVDARFVFVSGSDVQQALDEERIDVYIDLPSPGMRETASMLTVDCGMDYRQIVVVPSDSDVSRLYDLAGEKLCVISGSDAAVSLEEAEVFMGDIAGVIWCQTAAEQFDALDSGEAKGMLIDEPMYLYIMNGVDSDYKVLDELISQTGFIMAMRQHDHRLAGRVESLMEDMSGDGTLDRLRAYWFGM